MARWLLPENLSDALPEEARTVERLRRELLDLYASYGYELVIPPLLEHLESLLTGTGHDLDLGTLKLVDQLSGRTLGLRADTTPQVARIDAHILNRSGVARLCYAGSTLHARPAHPLASREWHQHVAPRVRRGTGAMQQQDARAGARRRHVPAQAGGIGER